MRRCASISMPSRFRSALAALMIRRWSTKAPSIQRLAAKEDILGRSQFRNQVQFLVNDRDAGALGVLNAREANRRALDPDLAVVVDVDAGQDLHQGRFACAVLAQ